MSTESNGKVAGKTFLVAGGTRGIGWALTRQLIADGGTVHVISRTLPANEELEMQSTGRFIHQECDFTDCDVEQIKIPETLHGVAYCPGSINLRSLRSLKADDFRQDFEINVVGAIRLLKACFPILKKSGQESATGVVLFSSIAAGTGLPMHASIAASKGAIEGLTRTLAAEWAPQVRVNCLAPALTETSLTSRFFANEEKRATLNASYPLGRTGLPEDVASMAGFLMGPHSPWITGQVIGVDGGMSETRL
ncbi:MAG: SDR family oxidoreductase [Planctomycetota bacterium]|nr:SDR family oxidoreductase [Planctomycetota bacterium]